MWYLDENKRKMFYERDKVDNSTEGFILSFSFSYFHILKLRLGTMKRYLAKKLLSSSDSDELISALWVRASSFLHPLAQTKLSRH